MAKRKFDKYDVFMKILEIIERDPTLDYEALPEEQRRKMGIVIARIEGNVLLNQILREKMEMRDQFSVDRSQVGVVGPDAHVHDVYFDQAWKLSSRSIELLSLATELSELRLELRKQAVEREHDAAVIAVADAEVAAKAGDGPRTLEHLAKAGKWAFDIATKIGTAVAAEAIKVATGLK